MERERLMEGGRKRKRKSETERKEREHNDEEWVY